jgi:hypothetical protein
MDFTSVEFYTIAFCVAMGLVGFFLGQKSVKPATSYITAFDIEPQDEDSTDKTSSIIKLSSNEDGTVTINRLGVHLVEGETINIIATLINSGVKFNLVVSSIFWIFNLDNISTLFI